MGRSVVSYWGALSVALAAGCTASGASNPLTVGSNGEGGELERYGGATNFVTDDAGTKALAVHVERKAVTVDVVTLRCVGDCADVVAVAKGGYPPYTYVWSDGTIGAERNVCPTVTTSYDVSATDSGSSGTEFARPPLTVHAPLTAKVLDCPRDAGVSEEDAGDANTVCADASTPAPAPPGRYTETIECPTSTSSGGASGVTGTIVLDLAADGTGTLFFQWSLAVLGAQGAVAPPSCSGGQSISKWNGSWGVPGFPDPNKPNDPPGLIPTGPVTGHVSVSRGTGAPNTLSGRFDWDAPPVANQPASICVGDFTATLKP